MNHLRKVYATATVTFLIFLMILSAVSMANAAGEAITLTPSSGDSGNSVTVTGSSFPANNSVGIGFGPLVAVDNEIINQTVVGIQFTGFLGYWLISPSSVSMSNTRVSDGRVTSIYDDGNGNLIQTDNGNLFGTLNYTSGKVSRESNQAIQDFVLTASYLHYRNVTPASGVTTTASGSFTTSITVPSLAVGSYVVVAMSGLGNRATSTFTVGTTIPEFPSWVILPIAAITALLAVTILRKKLNR